MKQNNALIAIVLATIISTIGCGALDVDRSVQTHQTSVFTTDVAGKHRFEVRVRYGENVAAEAIEDLLARIEIHPLSELFPGVKPEAAPAPVESIDPSGVEVRLHPLDEGVDGANFAWRLPHQKRHATTEAGIGHKAQGLLGSMPGLHIPAGAMALSPRGYYCRSITATGAYHSIGGFTACARGTCRSFSPAPLPYQLRSWSINVRRSTRRYFHIEFYDRAPKAAVGTTLMPVMVNCY